MVDKTIVDSTATFCGELWDIKKKDASKIQAMETNYCPVDVAS